MRKSGSCKICSRSVNKNNGLQCCGTCQNWIHYKCLHYSPGRVKDIKCGVIKVTCPCPGCKLTIPKQYKATATINVSTSKQSPVLVTASGIYQPLCKDEYNVVSEVSKKNSPLNNKHDISTSLFSINHLSCSSINSLIKSSTDSCSAISSSNLLEDFLKQGKKMKTKKVKCKYGPKKCSSSEQSASDTACQPIVNTELKLNESFPIKDTVKIDKGVGGDQAYICKRSVELQNRRVNGGNNPQKNIAQDIGVGSWDIRKEGFYDVPYCRRGDNIEVSGSKYSGVSSYMIDETSKEHSKENYYRKRKDKREYSSNIKDDRGGDYSDTQFKDTSVLCNCLTQCKKCRRNTWSSSSDSSYDGTWPHLSEISSTKRFLGSKSARHHNSPEDCERQDSRVSTVSDGSDSSGVEQLCNTVTELSQKIKVLMKKLKKTCKSNYRCIPKATIVNSGGHGRNCTTEGVSKYSPKPCNCQVKRELY